MTLNDYIENNRTEYGFTSRVEFNDGFSISIQASEGHYCSPRWLTDASSYNSFELGFPSEIDVLIDHLAEQEGTTETVYPYVDRMIVQNLIDKHGGIKGKYEHKQLETQGVK